MDVALVSNPVDIVQWLEGLTYETRLELCNQNLVQTQLLYGEEVLVIEEKEDWVQVFIPNQPTSKNKSGYPGWVPIVQLVKCPSDWESQEGPVAVVTTPKALLRRETNLELSFQTTLPLLKKNDGEVVVKTPDGNGLFDSEDVTIFESQVERFKGNGNDIVIAGKMFLNLPYLWGGMSSYGYDCSGFSYMMCKANGYIIPRDAHDQAIAGISVNVTDIQPGDLLFFAYEEGKGRIHHVGIYYGDGKLLHSPKTGKTIETIPLAGTIYEQELCAASRYWVETEV